jgi:hypothetical protein
MRLFWVEHSQFWTVFALNVDIIYTYEAVLVFDE